jgi:hypothetical protein
VVHEHHPEVLPADINKLGEEEAPVERELSDVVPPNVSVDLVVWIVGPTVADIPEPIFAPKADLQFEKFSLFIGVLTL